LECDALDTAFNFERLKSQPSPGTFEIQSGIEATAFQKLIWGFYLLGYKS